MQIIREKCFPEGRDDWFEDFKERTILSFPWGDGGFCVTRDPNCERIFWLHGGGYNKFLSVSKFKASLVLISAFGVEFLAAYGKNGMEKMLEWGGFQDMGKGLWSIRLNG